MNSIAVIFKKELKEYLTSPLTFIMLALFCFFLGWIFLNILLYNRNLYGVNITTTVVQPLLSQMNTLFFFMAPGLAMGLIAKEKSEGTIGLLFSSPISSWNIILGKYLAGSFLLLLFILSSLPMLPFLSLTGFNDWYSILTGYSGIYLNSLLYLAIGLCASTWTKNQLGALFITLIILFTLGLSVVAANAFSDAVVAQLFQYMSFIFHLDGFTRGIIKTYNLVYYFSFISFFLYVGERSIEARNW